MISKKILIILFTLSFTTTSFATCDKYYLDQTQKYEKNALPTSILLVVGTAAAAIGGMLLVNKFVENDNLKIALNTSIGVAAIGIDTGIIVGRAVHNNRQQEILDLFNENSTAYEESLLEMYEKVLKSYPNTPLQFITTLLQEANKRETFCPKNKQGKVVLFKQKDILSYLMDGAAAISGSTTLAPQTEEDIATISTDIPQEAKAISHYEMVNTLPTFLPVSKLTYTNTAEVVLSKNSLTAIKNEFETCHIQNLRVACLDSTLSSYQTFFIRRLVYESPDAYIHFGLMMDQETKKQILLVISTSKEEDLATINNATLFYTKDKSDLEKIITLYFNKKLNKIAEIEINSNSKEYIIDKLAQEITDHEFYHLVYGFLSLPELTQDDINELSTLIQEKTNLINPETTSESYQYNYVDLISTSLLQSTDLTIKVSQQLISSKFKKVRQVSALNLAQRNISSPVILREVRDATKNSSYQVRLRAIDALNKIKQGINDEKLIILMVDDSDSDVQKKAFNIAKTFPLSNQYLATIAKLANDSSWKTRNYSVSLLALIQTNESTNQLIHLLADSDSDVQAAAVRELNRRKMSEVQLATLISIKGNNKWKARQYAAHYIGKINSSAAVLALIPMLTDSDSDVKNTVISSLNNMTLTNLHLPELKKVLQNSSWKTRQLAIKLVSKIDSEDATAILFSMLADRDNDVKNAAIYAINARVLNQSDIGALINALKIDNDNVRNMVTTKLRSLSLSNTHLPQLQEVATKSSWESRRLIVQLINTIKTAEANEALLAMISDRDNDVKNAAISALNQRTLDQKNIPSLITLSKNRNWAMRRLAATYLNKISSSESTAALINMLSDSDGDVRKTVIAALNRRTLDDSNIASLLIISQNNDWKIRQQVAIFLGTIQSNQSTTALINMLNDSDSDVRRKVSSILNNRRFSNTHIDPLVEMLNSNRSETRKVVARYLGTFKNDKALNALINRLTIERDSDVKDALIKAISKIKS